MEFFAMFPKWSLIVTAVSLCLWLVFKIADYFVKKKRVKSVSASKMTAGTSEDFYDIPESSQNGGGSVD